MSKLQQPGGKKMNNVHNVHCPPSHVHCTSGAMSSFTWTSGECTSDVHCATGATYFLKFGSGPYSRPLSCWALLSKACLIDVWNISRKFLVFSYIRDICPFQEFFKTFQIKDMLHTKCVDDSKWEVKKATDIEGMQMKGLDAAASRWGASHCLQLGSVQPAGSVFPPWHHHSWNIIVSSYWALNLPAVSSSHRHSWNIIAPQGTGSVSVWKSVLLKEKVKWKQNMCRHVSCFCCEWLCVSYISRMKSCCYLFIIICFPFLAALFGPFLWWSNGLCAMVL